VDALLRAQERWAQAHAGDAAARLAHARRLARAGQRGRIRGLAREQLGARVLENDLLALAREAAAAEGRLGAIPAGRPRARIDRRFGRPVSVGAMELAPVVAFAGLQEDQSWRLARSALAALGADAARDGEVRPVLAFGEQLIGGQVPLRRPWAPQTGFVVRSLEVITLPSAPEASKLRRAGAAKASAVCVHLGERGAATDRRRLAALLGVCAQDLRLSGSGGGLAEAPLVLVHPTLESAAVHDDLARELGVPSAAFAVCSGPEGGAPPVDLLAHCLLEVRRAVAGLLRPRGGPSA
jgi:hypothetical protein